MRETEPSVYLIAEPKLLGSELGRYLSDIDAVGWETNAPTDAELLVEVAGRACYRSWKPGLNPNVTKVREGNDVYLKNILKSGHGSVLEHAQVTFIFRNVSRVFTHELVRHRVGVAISQESLRYVRLEDLSFWISDEHELNRSMVMRSTPNNPGGVGSVRDCVVRLVEQMEEFQKGAADTLIDEGTSFADKKRITSFLRRFAPIGLATSIVWSCNFRTLRHVIEMRTSPHAEEEIRFVFDEVARIATKRWPNVFQDYQQDIETGAWVTDSRKI